MTIPRHSALFRPIIALAAACLLPAHAHAQGTTIRARLVATVPSPVFITSAPADPTRLFVVSRNGPVRILSLPSGQLLATPFVQQTVSSTNGMLGMAFHPNFASNGIFYLSMELSTSLRVVRGHVSPATPDVADPALTPILDIPGGFGQHTGGWIGFGPDGYLYMPVGDGHDSTRAQNLTLLAGKVLRIDVDGPDNIPANDDDDAFPLDENNNYSIPPSNPFVGSTATPTPRAEIWAIGVRNPYRGSIDPETGDIWFGDVGSTREEINRIPTNTPARNLGWPFMEGATCTSTPANCATPNLTPAVHSYLTHGTGAFPGYSVMGGIVYRGCSMPHLRGAFLFADYFSSWLGAIRVEGSAVTSLSNRASGFAGSAASTGITAFGADANGEVYFCRLQNGDVYALEPVADRDCNNNSIPDACEGLPKCLADFDGDCGVSINDLVEFAGAFSAGTLDADCADTAGRELVDGAITIDDLLLYLVRFEAGC